jgi:hypothetical protein
MISRDIIIIIDVIENGRYRIGVFMLIDLVKVKQGTALDCIAGINENGIFGLLGFDEVGNDVHSGTDPDILGIILVEKTAVGIAGMKNREFE